MRRDHDDTLRAAAFFGHDAMDVTVRCAALLNRHGLIDVPLDTMEPM